MISIQGVYLGGVVQKADRNKIYLSPLYMLSIICKLNTVVHYT